VVFAVGSEGEGGLDILGSEFGVEAGADFAEAVLLAYIFYANDGGHEGRGEGVRGQRLAAARRPWSLVLGPWSLVLGPWSLVLGPWSLVLGPWSLVCACGAPVVLSPWSKLGSEQSVSPSACLPGLGP